MPSVAAVQNSCLMTLNNLLSVPAGWQPIVPDRRHSMPPQTSPVQRSQSVQSSSALHTLVSNLRNREGGGSQDIESVDESALFDELRLRVDALAPSLVEGDARFARVLVSLLSVLHQLQTTCCNATSKPQELLHPTSYSPIASVGPTDLLDMLRKQLGDLQIQRKASEDGRIHQSPIHAVQSALIWSKIDQDLETVVSLCKERTESIARPPSLDRQPPQYEYTGYEFDTPPEYDSENRASLDALEAKMPYSMQSAASSISQSEKMRLDFDAVTMAIDRLYLVAPQLHNQRVELKTAKLEQMERARRQGSNFSSETKGKQKERDLQDLDHMLDLIGRASDRKMADQSVLMDGARMLRLEKARQNYEDQRDAFVVELMEKSGAGRYHAQDAQLKERELDGLVSLPEFIREPIPPGMRISAAVRIAPSPPPSTAGPSSDQPAHRSALSHHKSNSRSRSMSAPSLSWLRSSSGLGRRISKSSSRPGSSHGRPVSGQAALDVSYIAEYRETLRHVVVFVSVSGLAPGAELEAEVLPTSSSGLEGDWLLVRSGSISSPPLSMPVQTVPGKQDVQVRQGYYELRLVAASTARSWDDEQDREPTPLMSASQLGTLAPTSFVCASCSLPLVHLHTTWRYRDLPSEHWEELVDAWMCHTDQTLHEHVAKHGRGFWPEQGEALVGGSYVLFDESSVVNGNLSSMQQSQRGEDWRMVRCLCGAVAGRRHERPQQGHSAAAMYRFFKYAVRPISPSAELPKVHVSAFVVQDMLEHVSAHATYRFVISDEEEERPRLLVWLFKPKIRLSYMLANPYLLAKNGSIDASKVMYKILGPSSPSADLKELLNKYPGFPQAEHLFYPLDVCRKLAGWLTESTESYPDGMRTMTGLDVGWLHRT
ncbi:hypothetical protein BV22DRAFT_193313 [Leucogyrophana mollusca]|uniref:Uncharacterized protein n=1 Tax=Leucogyrophana mollusca TaxID=85980 RepID=A0ACB8BT71_9AGAM|nr:hypothetical protein BV22DRAFT_193313 [Leucogyrophana mollusca]